MSHTRDLLINRLGLHDAGHPLAGEIGAGAPTLDDAVRRIVDMTDEQLLAIIDDRRLATSWRRAAELVWFASERRSRTEQLDAAGSVLGRNMPFATETGKAWRADMLANLDGTVAAVAIQALYEPTSVGLLDGAMANKPFDVAELSARGEMPLWLLGTLADAGAYPAGGWMRLTNLEAMPNAWRLGAVLIGMSTEVLDEQTARRYLRRAGDRAMRRAFECGNIGKRLVSDVASGRATMTAAAGGALADAKSAWVRALAGACVEPYDQATADAIVRDVLDGFNPERHGHQIAGLLWRVGPVSAELVETMANHPLTRWDAGFGLDVLEMADAVLALAIVGANKAQLDAWRASGRNALSIERIQALYSSGPDTFWAKLDANIGYALDDEGLAKWMLDAHPRSALGIVEHHEHLVRAAVADGLLERL